MTNYTESDVSAEYTFIPQIAIHHKCQAAVASIETVFYRLAVFVDWLNQSLNGSAYWQLPQDEQVNVEYWVRRRSDIFEIRGGISHPHVLRIPDEKRLYEVIRARWLELFPEAELHSGLVASCDDCELELQEDAMLREWDHIPGSTLCRNEDGEPPYVRAESWPSSSSSLLMPLHRSDCIFVDRGPPASIREALVHVSR